MPTNTRRATGQSCEAVDIVFGEHVTPAKTAARAEWIAEATTGAAGTIGAFMPRYPSILRVHPPPPSIQNWTKLQSELYGAIASAGAQHTSTPSQAWFAVWEGHGGLESHGDINWAVSATDEETRQEREQYKAQLHQDGARRNVALHQIPRFELPHRAYYLLTGTVHAVTQIERPGRPKPQGFSWHEPDFFWPQDKQWFVATDVDLWSTYVGGEHRFITELERSVERETEVVDASMTLDVEA